MKIKLLMAVALAAVIGFTSCDDARLASDIIGTWKGNTTEMMKGKKDKYDKDGMRKDGDRDRAGHRDDADMTCTPTLTFTRTDGTNGGSITLSGDYTVSRGVETAAIASPVKATVNGNITASGTWSVKDDDEIIISLDPAKTVIGVDTASLTLSYARLTDAPQDSLGSIRQRVASNITEAVRPMIAGKMQKIHKFDDVKIKGNTMTLEAGHNKMTFTKQ